jgi:arylformamidase
MFYDITPLISQRLKVWPGDTPCQRQVLYDMKRGDNLTLSTLRATVHLGAHADAPSHYGRDAQAIHERDLSLYIGPCRVVHVAAKRSALIEPEELPPPIQAERLLIGTGTYPDPTVFNGEFAALSPRLVDRLHDEGVRLIGIDTPSVDPFRSKDLPAHQRFLQHDMGILEGLVLKDVPAGRYELIALPLKLEGFDASPVRAILRPLP